MIAVFPVALNTESHNQLHVLRQLVARRDLSVAGGALDIRSRMPVVIEKHICFRRQPVNPAPRDFLPFLEGLLDLMDFRTPGFHN